MYGGAKTHHGLVYRKHQLEQLAKNLDDLDVGRRNEEDRGLNYDRYVQDDLSNKQVN